MSSPPSPNAMAWRLPSRSISTSTRAESALTTEMPTPWRPPDTLYPSPPNLPPACSTVSTTSAAVRSSYLGCFPTGIPRPSSRTSMPPSGRIETSIRLQWPAIASSTELSTTSQTRWCRPVGPVEPMYIPGRLRTASRPSRTVMSCAPYDDGSVVVKGDSWLAADDASSDRVAEVFSSPSPLTPTLRNPCRGERDPGFSRCSRRSHRTGREG